MAKNPKFSESRVLSDQQTENEATAEEPLDSGCPVVEPSTAEIPPCEFPALENPDTVPLPPAGGEREEGQATPSSENAGTLALAVASPSTELQLLSLLHSPVTSFNQSLPPFLFCSGLAGHCIYSS